MPSRVTIDISARDNASSALDSVRSKLVIFDQFGRQASDLTQKFEGTTRAAGGFDLSVSKLTRGVRGLAAPMLYELSPALGGTATGMASVVTSAALLGSGLGAVAIAGVGVAGVLGGRLYESWTKNSEAIEKMNLALRSADLEQVTTAVAAQADAVRGLAQAYREAEEAAKRARAEAAAGSGILGVAGMLGDLNAGPATRTAAGARRALAEGVEEEQRARTAQAALQHLEALAAAEIRANKELETLEAARAKTAAANRLADRSLGFGRLPSIEAEFRSTGLDAADREAAGDYAGAARLRDEARQQRRHAYAGTLGGGGLPPGQGFESAIAGADSAADRIARIAIEAQRAKTAIDELAASLERDVGGGQMETVLAGVSPEDLKRGTEREAARVTAELEAQLGITQHLALLTSQRTDLTLQQRESLTLARIETERILKLELARGDQAKEFAAEIEAALKRRQLLEATDARAGLRRGLTDVEVAFGSAGLRMQETAHTLGGDIARSLGDAMFDPIEQRMKDLPPLFRSMLGSMLRAVTDNIGQAITAQLFSGIKGLLPGGGSPGILPFVGSGGGGSLFGPGGPGAAPTVVVNVQGRPLPQSELATAFAAGGEAGVRALQQGRAAVVGGEYIPESAVAGSPEFTQSAYARRGLPPSFLDRALPIAGGAAALGLTAFGATGAQSGFDVGASAVLGGLTGAGLGRSLAPLFGASGGAGAGAGALAGAAINTTLALLARQEADKRAAKERQAAEVARAAGAGGALVSSASQAQSPADLFRRITAFGSGTTGGAANPAVSVTARTPSGVNRPIGVPNAHTPVATLQDLLAAPESLQANIQAGVDPGSLTGPNAATSKALQDRAVEMVRQFREREQGVGVTQEDRGPGGLTRRVTLPASRADRLHPALDVEIDALALQALSDDDRATALLDVLGRVAADKDIQSTISDGATGQIVSITRIARTSVGLPPAPTPVPAPVTPSPPPAPTPAPGTGELLTAGGAAAIGIAAQLADPNSLLNALLPTGYTGADLASLIQGIFSPTASGTVLSGMAPDVVRAAVEASGRTTVAVGFQGQGQGGFGFGTALDLVGGAASLYTLVAGAQTGDPLTIGQAALGLYSAIASGANQFFGAGLPTLGSVATAAIQALAQAGGMTAAQASQFAGAIVAPAAAVAAPAAIAIAAVLAYISAQEEMAARRSGWWNNPIRGQLHSNAETGLARAKQLQQMITQAGGLQAIPTAALQQLLPAMANNLLPVYQTAQGGAGAIKASDTLTGAGGGQPLPGGNVAQRVADTAAAKNFFAAAVQELLRRGVPYEEIGQIPMAGNWALQSLDAGGTPREFFERGFGKYAAEGGGILGRVRAPQIEEYGWVDTGGEGGTMWGPTGRMVAAPMHPFTVDDLFVAAMGSAPYDGEGRAKGLVEGMYGGPLWAALARLGAPGLQGLIQEHFDPWVVLRGRTGEDLFHVLNPDTRALQTEPFMDPNYRPSVDAP